MQFQYATTRRCREIERARIEKGTRCCCYGADALPVRADHYLICCCCLRNARLHAKDPRQALAAWFGFAQSKRAARFEHVRCEKKTIFLRRNQNTNQNRSTFFFKSSRKTFLRCFLRRMRVISYADLNCEIICGIASWLVYISYVLRCTDTMTPRYPRIWTRINCDLCSSRQDQ